MLFDTRPKSSRSELYGRDKELDELISALRPKIPLLSSSVLGELGKHPLMKTALNELGLPHMYLTPSIALALATENEGIWTEDRHMEKTEDGQNMEGRDNLLIPTVAS